MRIFNSPISDLKVVETTPNGDSRGVFTRFFCDDELRSIIGNRRILQINHSRTSIVGTVRGLHFQYPPNAEMKLVRCIKGRVWDVAVDIRQNSATFLHWYAKELTPANAIMMVIPEGFAHGFQVVEPESELIYLHTTAYSPSSEGGLLHDDPSIAIRWPLSVTEVSRRDKTHTLIEKNFLGVSI